MVGTLIHSIPLYVGIPISYQTNYEEYKQLLLWKIKYVSPVVYLESYFESFKSGTSVEEIANQILDVLHSSPTDIVEKFFNLS